jgi:putative FmdB family regulatory protein
MPLYDFRCAACGAVFEQRLSLAALGQPVPCPSCGTPTAERLVSRPALLGRATATASAAPLPGAT